MWKTYYVCIMASRKNGTLYIGVTGDLACRIWQHRERIFEGFTKEYDVKMLVHYERFADVANAIHRETRPKKWKRRRKIGLIEETNPQW
jgi:putative endonuclease